jgi:NitT/TauT family transport system ATP-binding protein
MKRDDLSLAATGQPCCRSPPSARPSRRHVALQATDLAVQENDFITILGLRAAARAPCCALVAGLDTPTGGRIALDGRTVTGPGADRGMVFQSYTLFPWLTVLQNVCFGLREKGIRRAEQEPSPSPSSPRWAEGLRAPLPQAALRRHAAAHRAGPRAGQRPAHPADGRALRRAGPPDARADAGAAAGIWEGERKTVLFVTHDIDEPSSWATAWW